MTVLPLSLLLLLLEIPIATARLNDWHPGQLVKHATHGARSALRYGSSFMHRGPASHLKLDLEKRCLAVPPPIGLADNSTYTSSATSLGSSTSLGTSTTSLSSPDTAPSTTSLFQTSSTTTQSSFSSSSSSTSTSSSATSSTASSSSTVLSPAPSTTSTSATPSPTATSIWNVVESFSGNTFFNGFDFWTVGDPTDGDVDYVDYDTAQSLGLIGINPQNHAVLAVSTVQTIAADANRPSVRITTSRNFTGGLLVADIYHMPHGCGTWPSFWTCGPDWPDYGEIDIIEGIHDDTINTASVHTAPGCYMPANYGASGTLLTPAPVGLDCSEAETNDAGCGLVATQANTYGSAFNNVQGGVYAMQWDETGIEVWFFQRGSIPADIPAGLPEPTGWGTPQGAWPASTCAPYTFFQNHSAIFDTTICGAWAGGAQTWDNPGLGQAQSCAVTTGFATCDEFIRANGSAFVDAYWEIASVVLYQKAGQQSWLPDGGT